MNGEHNGVEPLEGSSTADRQDGVDGSGTLRWTTGTGDSLRTVYDGGCLDLAFGGGVAEASCQSGASSQSWART
ncbi:hypothetical protein [Streptomyces sp. NPDC001135]